MADRRGNWFQLKKEGGGYMNNPRILATLSLAVVSAVASAQTAQTSASLTTLVTVENYNRAQTDINFAGVVKNGGFGKFPHGRRLSPPPQKGIFRPNPTTLFSFAILVPQAPPRALTPPTPPNPLTLT